MQRCRNPLRSTEFMQPLCRMNSIWETHPMPQKKMLLYQAELGCSGAKATLWFIAVSAFGVILRADCNSIVVPNGTGSIYVPNLKKWLSKSECTTTLLLMRRRWQRKLNDESSRPLLPDTIILNDRDHRYGATHAPGERREGEDRNHLAETHHLPTTQLTIQPITPLGPTTFILPPRPRFH